MAKRQKINYNGEELSRNLKRSTGQGVDAFFPDQTSAPSQPTTQTVETVHQGADANTQARIGTRTSGQTDTSNAPIHAYGDARTDARVSTQVESPDEVKVDESMDARTDARIHAPSDTPGHTAPAATVDESEGIQIEAIQKLIRAKRHLSSFTFRFRTSELEDLNLVMDELNQSDEYKISKNDAVRTALNWLLADYGARKQGSILARVLMDT